MIWVSIVKVFRAINRAFASMAAPLTRIAAMGASAPKVNVSPAVATTTNAHVATPVYRTNAVTVAPNKTVSAVRAVRFATGSTTAASNALRMPTAPTDNSVIVKPWPVRCVKTTHNAVKAWCAVRLLAVCNAPRMAIAARTSGVTSSAVFVLTVKTALCSAKVAKTTDLALVACNAETSVAIAHALVA